MYIFKNDTIGSVQAGLEGLLKAYNHHSLETGEKSFCHFHYLPLTLAKGTQGYPLAYTCCCISKPMMTSRLLQSLFILAMHVKVHSSLPALLTSLTPSSLNNAMYHPYLLHSRF